MASPPLGCGQPSLTVAHPVVVPAASATAASAAPGPPPDHCGVNPTAGRRLRFSRQIVLIVVFYGAYTVVVDLRGTSAGSLYPRPCMLPLIVASVLLATGRLALSRFHRSVPGVVLDGTYGSRSKRVLGSENVC